MKASEISYGAIPALEKEMELASEAESQLPSMVSEQVGPQDVAEVVAMDRHPDGGDEGETRRC